MKNAHQAVSSAKDGLVHTMSFHKINSHSSNDNSHRINCKDMHRGKVQSTHRGMNSVIIFLYYFAFDVVFKTTNIL